MNSILISIKKMLGIVEDYNVYDMDLIIDINSVFMILNQLGVGPAKCFIVTDESQTWDDFTEIDTNIEAVKTYMYLKVKMMFDPPTISTVRESNLKLIDELEFRLSVASESNRYDLSDEEITELSKNVLVSTFETMKEEAQKI